MLEAYLFSSWFLFILSFKKIESSNFHRIQVHNAIDCFSLTKQGSGIHFSPNGIDGETLHCSDIVANIGSSIK